MPLIEKVKLSKSQARFLWMVAREGWSIRYYGDFSHRSVDLERGKYPNQERSKQSVATLDALDRLGLVERYREGDKSFGPVSVRLTKKGHAVAKAMDPPPDPREEERTVRTLVWFGKLRDGFRDDSSKPPRPIFFPIIRETPKRLITKDRKELAAKNRLGDLPFSGLEFLGGYDPPFIKPESVGVRVFNSLEAAQAAYRANLVETIERLSERLARKKQDLDEFDREFRIDSPA